MNLSGGGTGAALTHDHSDAANSGNIPQSSVTNLVADIAAAGGLAGFSKVMDDLREYMASLTSSTFSTHITDGDWHCLFAGRYAQTGTWEMAADTYTVPVGKRANLVQWGQDISAANGGANGYHEVALYNVTDAAEIIIQDENNSAVSYAGHGNYALDFGNTGMRSVAAGKEFGIRTFLASDMPRAASMFVIFKVVDA
jgi:hypothetical protein